jgi:predicted DNA-binding antitoxin AbrB/MazE fold protein
MAITVEPIYENGVLRLTESVPLQEQAKVRVTIHTAAEQDLVQTAYGLIGWTGDSETVQRIAFGSGVRPGGKCMTFAQIPSTGLLCRVPLTSLESPVGLKDQANA